MLQQLYHRRPLRFAVTVDGRTMGQPYRTSTVAKVVAEGLQSEAPWAVVEVVETYH